MSADALTPEQRAQLGAELAAERVRMGEQLAGLEQTFQELVDAADLQPPDDEHDPEGTTAYERAQVSSLARIARTQLADLDRALQAVDADPSFGACAGCGHPIGFDRLQAVPGTDRCVTCAAT